MFNKTDEKIPRHRSFDLHEENFDFLGEFLAYIYPLISRHKYALLIEFALNSNIHEISKDVINCILCIISQETKLSGSV